MLYFAKASLTSDILLSKLGMARNVLIKKFSNNQYAQLSKVRAEKNLMNLAVNSLGYLQNMIQRQSLT